jgi:hypothetical protein
MSIPRVQGGGSAWTHASMFESMLKLANGGEQMMNAIMTGVRLGMKAVEINSKINQLVGSKYTEDGKVKVIRDVKEAVALMNKNNYAFGPREDVISSLTDMLSQLKVEDRAANSNNPKEQNAASAKYSVLPGGK